ncbi:Temperature-induced lipocalin-1 [Sesamum angolense]|uniref:Temperature-induced lipocalin-1 n=1 Tax=Sesamum angolense TaxID=2727404 RepID=A0AAE2C064_9LAMI|nr:Temperature-induced lipocalin-1 [Sesamum angolense]
MEVVKDLDVERYMGRWYEIASLPSRFQPRNGADTRATYTLNPDGTVHVLNETWSGGKRGYIKGTAYKVDPKSNEAKLKVRFYVPPFLPIIPVTGDYWILYIDWDYQHALIGQPTRRYLWHNLPYDLDDDCINELSSICSQILCRQPRLDEETYSQLVEKAEAEGYFASKLYKTPHSDTPPEDAPKDTKGISWFKSILRK